MWAKRWFKSRVTPSRVSEVNTGRTVRVRGGRTSGFLVGTRYRGLEHNVKRPGQQGQVFDHRLGGNLPGTKDIFKTKSDKVCGRDK